MKTKTLTTKHKENHIINGSANLNYSFEDVKQLPEKDQLNWYWYAIVQLKMNITNAQLLAETNKELIFEQIQDANFTEITKRTFAEGTLNLNGFKTNFVAQLQTLLAYGDTSTGEIHKITGRQLKFITECENLQDLFSCARIVESYNEFSSNNIAQAYSFLNKLVFYSESNPNNNKELFKFSFGRESSPVIYVSYSTLQTDHKYIVNRTGASVEVAPYTKDLFYSEMQAVKNIFKCDEFSINEDASPYGVRTLTARFWFD